MTDHQNSPFEPKLTTPDCVSASNTDNANIDNTSNNPISTPTSESEHSNFSVPPTETATYLYSFPSEETVNHGQAQTPPHKKERKGFWGRILFASITVLLAAAVSFVAAFAGTVIANQISKEEPIYDPPGQDQLYQSNAASLLTKEDSATSLYGSAGEDVFSISQVVNQVRDAVVVIDVKISVPSIYGTQTSTSAGSGVIISPEGYILTCHHVIDSAKEIVVTLNSGKKYSASLVGSDANSDLAIIRIMPQENEPLTYVKQGCSDNLVIGEQVVAIGNSLGQLGGTVTDGIISATERELMMDDGTKMTLLQTNAAINQGNSGGGLFNLDGELVGIVNAKISASGVEGLAFAIPIDRAYTVELDLIQYGYVRGVVDHGLSTVDVTKANLNLYYIKHRIDTVGVYIVSSQYDAQSLLNKDRIVSVNEIEIFTTEELNEIMKQYKVGDTVSLVIERDDQIFSYNLTLREYVPDYITAGNN